MIIPTANRLQNVPEYYFSRKLKEIRQMMAEGRPVINLGIGNPDLKPSEAAIAAVIATAQQDNAHGYQGYIGIPALRTAKAKWYQDTYGVNLNPDKEILPLIGSKEGIMHISMAFLNPGDAVLVPNPGYLTYSSVSRLVGASIQTYQLEESLNWQADLAKLEAMDLTKVKIMWVNYPNMPTGADADPEYFKRLIAFAKKHEILVVNDNPYSLILNDEPKSILQIEGAKDVCVELNSLSKSHNMAGWRVGMLVGKAAYIQSVLRVKSNMDSGMFLGIQQAAIAALGNQPAWFAAQNKVYQKRKKAAQAILDLLGCTYAENQVGLFIWAKVGDGVENVETWIDELLYSTNVFITPGFIFGSAGERYIRISLCSKIAQLEEARRRIADINQKI